MHGMNNINIYCMSLTEYMKHCEIMHSIWLSVYVKKVNYALIIYDQPSNFFLTDNIS